MWVQGVDKENIVVLVAAVTHMAVVVIVVEEEMIVVEARDVEAIGNKITLKRTSLTENTFAFFISTLVFRLLVVNGPWLGYM